MNTGRARGGDRAYLTLLAGVGAQRLAELLLSRRNERRAGAARGTAGDRSYPAMVALHVALFALPLAERRLLRRRARPALALPALAIEAGATALRLWVIATLGENWNVRGRVPAAMTVADGGPYRWLRHPNYTAVALEMAALPLAGGAALSAALLSAGNALVLLPRVRAEEALLAQVPGYNERMAHKPRFLPRHLRPTGRAAIGSSTRLRGTSPGPLLQPGGRSGLPRCAPHGGGACDEKFGALHGDLPPAPSLLRCGSARRGSLLRSFELATELCRLKVSQQASPPRSRGEGAGGRSRRHRGLADPIPHDPGGISRGSLLRAARPTVD